MDLRNVLNKIWPEAETLQYEKLTAFLKERKKDWIGIYSLDESFQLLAKGEIPSLTLNYTPTDVMRKHAALYGLTYMYKSGEYIFFSKNVPGGDSSSVTIVVSTKTGNECITDAEYLSELPIIQYLSTKKRFFGLKHHFQTPEGFAMGFTEEELPSLFRGDDFVWQLDADDVKGKCTCSNELQEGYDMFQWSDYVTRPMVWCDRCGRRSFICLECKPVVVKTEESISYTYPLMNITGVVNYQIYKWGWTQETFEKFFDDFLKIDNQQGVDYSNARDQKAEFCHERGIPLLSDSEDDEQYDAKSEGCFVRCDSNDTQDVKKPIDMRHDGIRVYCFCECKKCGSKFRGCYWGD